MKKETYKTNAEWDKINFKNNLGPQIGGLLHDAVALTISSIQSNKHIKYTTEIIQECIETYLDTLYDIAEAKKADLLEIKPVSWEQAKEANEAFTKSHKGETSKERRAKSDSEYSQVEGQLKKEEEDNKPF